MSSPNFAGKIEYYGIPGLNVGISGYFGNTQSALYDGMDKNNETTLASADSSVVGIAMLGLDERYQTGGLQLRVQYYLANISNTEQYNFFTASGGIPNNLGSLMAGYYVEAGYNVFRSLNSTDSQLIPFVRLEGYNTHQKTDDYLEKNPTFNVSVITTGLTWKITPGAVMKLDVQFKKPDDSDSYKKVLNAGFGVMF
jgi:hypothetical protein